MRIAILAPISWRTPPRQYGPWELVASNITEELVARGHDVTLFATADSITTAKLESCIKRGYSEDPDTDAKVNECLHISQVFEAADNFDIIHNHFDFLPLTYTRLTNTPVITTIHGFSSEKIIPVYKKYNQGSHYVSISNANRHPDLDYLGTVYNGINSSGFTFRREPGDYFLFFGRIHPEKGTSEAIGLARRCNRKLIIAGPVQDTEYFNSAVRPHIDNDRVVYLGNCDPQERDKLLGNALALLHLISFDEPFGLSVAESMFCGTPVIAYARGSMPELIRHGRTGFLANNMDEAADAAAQIAAINRNDCREWAMSMFTREKMVDDYISLYKQALSA
ncbi:MAG: glycosyltransferase family 4 protein [Chitinophagaceae bacterium]|nr:MAG: glycosyltransferase family 4 protein [Chitinophagaceae bacterium]